MGSIVITEVTTEGAPRPTGAFSQAVRAGGFIFVAGQTPFAPNGEGPVGETAYEQTEQVLGNLEAVLLEAGAGLEHVVKTTAYLDDLEDLGSYNEAYSGFFSDPLPARATIGCDLPGFKVEIEAVALDPRGTV